MRKFIPYILIFLLLASPVFAGKVPGKLTNASGGIINPATEDKQDTVITELQTLAAISSVNSSTANLGNGGVFTGTGVDTLSYASAVVSVFTDQDSAAGGLSIEYSSDNSNWNHMHTYTITANTGRGIEVSLEERYLRIVYTNGTTPQGAFRLQTKLSKLPNSAHTHGVEYVIDGTHPASINRSILVAKNASGVYGNINRTNGGNLKISLEEVEVPVKDSVSDAIIAIDFEHHECHEEDCFFSSFGNDVAGIGEQTSIAFTTAASGDRIHMIMDASAGLESFASIYENTSIDVDEGTEQNPFNRFRGSANTSQALSVETTPVVNTVTTYNETQAATANITTTTEVFHEHIGVSGNPSVRSGGASRGRSEYILDRSTEYAFCVTAIDGNAQHHNVRLNYYEHTDSN